MQSVSKRVPKEASTPFVPDGASVNTDWDEKGALSTCASRLLMNILWCARLARPELGRRQKVVQTYVLLLYNSTSLIEELDG